MLFVRSLTIAIVFLSFTNQSYAMLGRVTQIGKIASRQAARSLSTGQTPKNLINSRRAILAVGATTGVVVAGKYLNNRWEAKAIEVNLATHLLENEKNLIDFVTKAEELGINPNHPIAKGGTTALIFACKNNDADMFIKLINLKGFYVNAQDADGMTAFMYTCKNNNFYMAKALMMSRDIKLETETLIFAIHSLNFSFVELLLNDPRLHIDMQEVKFAMLNVERCSSKKDRIVSLKLTLIQRMLELYEAEMKLKTLQNSK